MPHVKIIAGIARYCAKKAIKRLEKSRQHLDGAAESTHCSAETKLHAVV